MATTSCCALVCRVFGFLWIVKNDSWNEKPRFYVAENRTAMWKNIWVRKQNLHRVSYQVVSIIQSSMMYERRLLRWRVKCDFRRRKSKRFLQRYILGEILEVRLWSNFSHFVRVGDADADFVMTFDITSKMYRIINKVRQRNACRRYVETQIRTRALMTSGI